MSKIPDKYRLLIENLPDAFAYHRAIYDQRGEPEDYIFLNVNAAFEAMTGLKRNEVIDKKVSEVLPGIKESSFDWIGTYGRLALEGGTIRFENYSDPLQRYYEVTAYSNEKLYFAAVFRDITEQRKTENLLREKNEQLRGIVESQYDLIIRLDLDGCFQYVNDALCKTVGRDRENLLGSSFIPLVHPDDLELTKKVIDGLLSKNNQDYLEHRALTVKDYRWIAWVGSAIRDEDGKVIEIQGVGRDITAQKDAEAELKAIQLNLEHLVEERTAELEEANLNLKQEVEERKKTAASLHHSNKQLELLFETSNTIAQDKKTAPLTQAIVDTVAKLTALKTAALYTLTADLLHLEATYPPLPPDFPEPLRLAPLADHPHIGKAIAHKQPVVLADSRRADLTAAEKEVCDMRQLRSLLYLPLISQGKAIGVLIIGTVETLHEFTEEEIAVSQTLAGMAALALTDARLNEAQQKYIAEIEEKNRALEQAEKRVLQNEQRVTDILRHAENVAFVTTDVSLPEPQILDFSYGAEQIFGYKKEEVMGKRVSILHTPEDVKQFPNVIEEMRNNQTGFSGESVLVRKGGEHFTALFKTHPLFDEQGNMWGTFGVSIDISDRKQAEEELYRFKAISDNAVFGQATSDVNGNLIYINKFFANIHGYETEELIGQPSSIFHTEKQLEKVYQLFSQLLKNGKFEPQEVWHVHRNGTEFPMLMSGITLNDEQGNYQSFATSAVDITRLKETEEELAHNLEVYRKGLEGMILAMSTLMNKRDGYTAAHQARVTDLALAIAGEMGLEEARIEGLKLAAEVHDIGKIGIPAEILTKPGALSELEYKIMQTHPGSGYDILKNIDFPWPLAEIVAQHHEKIDGSGYPEGLSGDEILLEAKIICVADAVEAMASHRPYRPALGIAAALEEIERQRGILFDEKVVDVCLRLFRDKGFQLEQ